VRLLIAEDDPVLADGLLHCLRDSGYAVDCVGDGVSADAALASMPFDLLVLDLGMPRMSGLDVLRKLRARKSNIPVLILTAHDSTEECVRGLDLGADDYLTKPFELPELEARLRALTRRSGHDGQAIVEHGALRFDTVGKSVHLNGELLELTARELRLLELLLSRGGRLVSKEQILDHLCQWGEEVSENAVEVYVHRLRRKLEAGGVRISTLRGLGYCLGTGYQDPR
jgi:two-component system OmpR family response regulator